MTLGSGRQHIRAVCSPHPLHLQSSTWDASLRTPGSTAPPASLAARPPLPPVPCLACPWSPSGAAPGPGGPALCAVHFPWDTHVRCCLTNLEGPRGEIRAWKCFCSSLWGCIWAFPCWPLTLSTPRGELGGEGLRTCSHP